MSFPENLDAFFNEKEFADEVTIVESNRKFPGIFDELFFDPETNEVYLEGSKPFINCKASDLGADLAKGKKLQVKGRTFSVLQVQPEGTGTAIIVLSVIA